MKSILAGWLLAVTTLLTIGHARAEIRDQAANGFTVVNSQWVPATPEQTWRALVEDVGLWWPADHTWWGDASKLRIDHEPVAAFAKSTAIGRPGI